jgi:MFS family permease
VAEPQRQPRRSLTEPDNLETAPLPRLPVTEPDGPGEPTIRHVRLFGSHAFFRLWLAQVVSAMGDWIGFVAIVAVAARVGGRSPESAVSVVMIARIVPGFFLAPVAGVLVDRWDRKRVMFTCDLARGAVLATVPFVDTVWGLFIASLFLEIPTLMWSPAKEASVPKLVRPDYLTNANSLSLVAAYGTFPIATALFALLAEVAEWLGQYDALDALRLNPESVAIYFDVMTFFVSALIVLSLPLGGRPKRSASTAGRQIDFAQTFRELKEGWRLIFVDPVVRAVMVGISTGLIGGGMLVPLGPVFSRQVLGAGPSGFGLLLTALGTGVAIGVIALSTLQRHIPKPMVFAGSVLGAGLCLALAALTSDIRAAFALIVLLGVHAGAVYVLGFTILQENVDDELRGRIFSALYTLVRLCLLLSFGVAGLLSRLLDGLSADLIDRDIGIGGWDVFLPGVRLTLLFAAAIMVAAGVLAILSLRAGGRRQADTAVVDPA